MTQRLLARHFTSGLMKKKSYGVRQGGTVQITRNMSDKGSKKKEADDAKSKELKIILAALDAPEKKEGPIPQEEKERRAKIGREYGIGRIKQHNEIGHDITCKIRMKEHAINMLPKNTRLREEALKISDEQPPKWRNIPVWTPPIKDFDPTQYTTNQES